MPIEMDNIADGEMKLPMLRLEIIKVFLQRNDGATMECDGSKRAFGQIGVLLRTAAGIAETWIDDTDLSLKAASEKPGDAKE